MSRLRIVQIIMVTVLSLPSLIQAEVLIDNVRGSISFTRGTYTRRDAGCALATVAVCTDSPTVGMVFGSGGPCLCDNCWGTISGKVNLVATIDGVNVTNGALLPSAAHFVSVMDMRRDFCPAECGFFGDCAGYTCDYMTYIIAGVTRTMAAAGTVTLDVAATAARSGVDFEFRFCNKQVAWGTACGWVGSANYRFKLYLPAALEIESFASGDSPPRPMGASGATVDFSSGPGGMVSATRVSGNPPFPVPNQVVSEIVTLPGYWEVSTNMAQGTYLADMTLNYDPSLVPPGEEGFLYVFAYDLASGMWTIPSRLLDEQANRITVVGLNRFSVYIVAVVHPNPTESVTWGGVKALYHNPEP